jgi:beta-fructofuranosidase
MSAMPRTADPWRQNFHIAAICGLVNDPNGLIHWRGESHVFYQLNPEGCTHKNKAWAHAASADLVHWRRLPIAISPVDRFDRDGCYSGSAVEDAGDLVLIYTGNVRDEQGARETYQCLARSKDGIVFDKLGPAISGPLPGYTAHFRDPKVWRQDGLWHMVLGAQTTALQGTVLLLSSADLEEWRLTGQLLAPGAHGYMCECPDLFTLDGADVLMFSEQTAAADDQPATNIAGWVTGRLDPATAAYEHGQFQRLDHGRDFYAPQSFSHADGRRIMLGWMGLPEQDSAPTIAHGWFHCLSIPRELRVIEGQLCQQPIRELAGLRGPKTRIQPGAGPIALNSPCYELDLEGISSPLELALRIGQVERTLIILEHDHIRLRSIDEQGVATELGAAALVSSGAHRLRIFVDHSSIEIFVDAGEVVLSARIYPGAEANGMALLSPEPQIAAFNFWPMASMWWDEGHIPAPGTAVTTGLEHGRVEGKE